MIKRNSFYSILTMAVKTAATFALIFALARLFSRNDFGIFLYSLTFSTVLGLLIDYGYPLKLLQQSALDHRKIDSLTSHALCIKLFVSLISISLIFIYIKLTQLPDNERIVLINMSMAAIAYSFGNLLLTPFKSVNRYQIETYFVGADSLMTFIICTVVAWVGHNIIWLSVAYLIEKALFLLATSVRYGVSYQFTKIHRSKLKRELSTSMPYAVHYFLSGVYLSVDTLILKQYVTNSAIALYQGGIRLVIGVGVVLALTNSVLLPYLSVKYHQDRRDFISAAKRLNRLFIALGAIFSILLYTLAKYVILITYGSKYLPLSNFMWIFCAIIFLRYLGGLYGVLITVAGNQIIRAIATFATLVFIVVADIIVIPRYGIIGAGLVLLAAHILLDSIYIYFTKSHYKQLFI